MITRLAMLKEIILYIHSIYKRNENDLLLANACARARVRALFAKFSQLIKLFENDRSSLPSGQSSRARFNGDEFNNTREAQIRD